MPVKEPLMPLHLFKNRNYVALSTISGVGAMIFYALNLIYPQQIASVWGESIVHDRLDECTYIPTHHLETTISNTRCSALLLAVLLLASSLLLPQLKSPLAM